MIHDKNGIYSQIKLTFQVPFTHLSHSFHPPFTHLSGIKDGIKPLQTKAERQKQPFRLRKR